MRKVFGVSFILLAAGFVLFLFKEPIGRAIKQSALQVERTQQYRKAWNQECLDAGGRIVYNGKGSPSYLCFGPDGRLLRTR